MSATVQSVSGFSSVTSRLVKLPTSLSSVNITLSKVRAATARDVAKRSIDIAFVTLSLPFTGTVALVGVGLACLDGGSPFYGHQRVGRDGRSFTCWKIRTMRPDATGGLEAVLAGDPAKAAEWRRDQKLRDDPRVTRVGRVLRKWGIDELPQLWNVMKGEMSLVGPRPVTRGELVRYGRSAGHYCSVRPGLTGAWQVSRSDETSYAERVARDRLYAQSHSALGDLALICRTVPSLLRGAGC